MGRTTFRPARKIVGQYRSGLEKAVADQLNAAGVPFTYEGRKIPFTPKPTYYKPDFELPNGIIVETKGRFPTEERTQHLLVKAQHPSLDIRFVFSDPYKSIGGKKWGRFKDWLQEKHGRRTGFTREELAALHRQFIETLPVKERPSKTTYAMWCEQHGFKFAKGRVPEEWLREPR